MLFPILTLFGVVTQEETGVGPLVPLAVLVPLAALGAGVIRSATRATVLSLRGGRATLFSGAALLRPVKSWPIDAVESVSVNVRGVTERMRLSADLNLRLRGGGGTTLVIAGRARDDLEWVATGLRVALAHRGPRAGAAAVDTP
jgi:hypothetical protein